MLRRYADGLTTKALNGLIVSGASRREIVSAADRKWDNLKLPISPEVRFEVQEQGMQIVHEDRPVPGGLKRTFFLEKARA
jgi:hypothetical protein